MLDSTAQRDNQDLATLCDADMFDKNNAETLARKAAGGDQSAFEQLINRHYADIYRFSFRLTQNKTDAEDLTQDALLKIAKHIHRFKFDCAFLSWVYRIVINTQKDNYKKYTNRLKRETQYHEQWQSGRRLAEPDETLAYRELLEAIDQLPDKLRLTMILVYAEHLSHARAAQVLACSVNTVSWRIHEAKKQLKKILKYQS